jgi:hypothetical protein
MTRATVNARIKQGNRATFKDTSHLPILCGRTSGSGTFNCGGDLGRIWRCTARKDSDLSDLRAWFGVVPKASTSGSIALPALLALADARRCHVGETPDGKRYQIWLAEHKIGYRRLPNGTYEVLRERDPVRESQRVLRNRMWPDDWGSDEVVERHVGRVPLPKDMADLVRSHIGVADGTPFGLGMGGSGVVGEVPPIPSVIICPRCGTPNHVLALAFDERRGAWYTCF